MAAPQALSGNDGEIVVGGSRVAEQLKWRMTVDRGLKEYGALSGVSGGVGWMKTVLGTHKASGTLEGLFDPNFPVGSIVDTDALVTLTLYLSLSKSAYVTGTARIASRDMSVDIDTGDPEPFTYNFTFHGPPTFVGI